MLQWPPPDVAPGERDSLINKFEQFSSDDHQISLAGGSHVWCPLGQARARGSHVWCPVTAGAGRGGCYNEVQYIMGNGHIGTLLWTE